MTTDADPIHLAERAALDALVSAPELVKLVPGLTPDHFGNDLHGVVFAATLEASTRDGEVPDSTTVLDVLRRREDLVRVVGAPYLHSLVSECVTTLNLLYYARLVAEGATRRTVERLATRMVQVAHSPD